MVRYEVVTIGGKDYVRARSDEGLLIEREGERYLEAVDPLDSGREYLETGELPQ